MLPGDLTAAAGQVQVQPDVLITSRSLYVFIEAKAPKTRATFGPEQLAREVVAAHEQARGRPAVLLLVLGAEPPVAVRGHGRIPVDDAITLGLTSMAERGLGAEGSQETAREGVRVCWTTWRRVAEQVKAALGAFDNPDPSVVSAVKRVANQLTEAVRIHSAAGE